MLSLPPDLRARLEAWSRAAYPHEACGVLVGAGARVTCVVRGPNLECDRPGERFELDPGAIVRADREARARGEEVLGIWHSHPDGPALPSERDLTGVWSGWAQVIVAVAGNGATSVYTGQARGLAALSAPAGTLHTPASSS